MISISIASDFAILYPEARVGFFTAGRHPNASDAEKLAGRLAQEALEALRERRIDIDRLADDQPFLDWRKAFSKGGLQPSKFRSSVEALTRRALRHGRAVLTGSALVDIYNALSVKHLTPMGAYDVERLPGEKIELRFARPASDHFEPVGGDPSHYPLKAGMPVYACSDEILCYGFNHRDSSVTACRDESDPILFVAEAVSNDMASTLGDALAELRNSLVNLNMETSQIAIVGR